MKRIAHISDLHFGTEAQPIADGLRKDLLANRPDVLVVSGDLTQRARTRQFLAAKAFLAQLPFPKVIVPGNHDIPLYDIVRRFLAPLKRYCRFISADLRPFYQDHHKVAILGINTARSLTWKEGRISIHQLDHLKEKLCPLPTSVFKIVVTHHPFIPPPNDLGINLVGRSRQAMEIIDTCGVDLLLAGHLHQGYCGDVRTYYPQTRSSIVAVQAGTAISRRIREEPNGYNLIAVESGKFSITIREWNGDRFNPKLETRFVQKGREWIRRDG